MNTNKKQTFFGRQLKKIMYEKNITQAELAEKLGINSSMISQWVTGTGNPRLKSVRKIAAVLGIPVNSLIEENFSAGSNEQSNCKDKNVNINLIMKLIEENNKRFEAEISYIKEVLKKFEKEFEKVGTTVEQLKS